MKVNYGQNHITRTVLMYHWMLPWGRNLQSYSQSKYLRHIEKGKDLFSDGNFCINKYNDGGLAVVYILRVPHMDRKIKQLRNLF